MEIKDIRLMYTGGRRWLKVTNDAGRFVRIPITLEQAKTLTNDLIRHTPGAAPSKVDTETRRIAKQLEQLTIKLNAKLCEETVTRQTETG